MNFCSNCGTKLTEGICGKCRLFYENGRCSSTLNPEIKKLKKVLEETLIAIDQIQANCKHKFVVSGQRTKMYYSEFSDYGIPYQIDIYSCIYCEQNRCE